MVEERTREDLLAEGEAVPTEGWDFSWFDGRATEERPPWGYRRMLAARLGTVDRALDIQTGGGEVTASVPEPPGFLAATEAWPPNRPVAQRNLGKVNGHVVGAAERGGLPFRDGTFDLVVSRHPVATEWGEVARVLKPGGAYLSQQIGPGSNRELTDFMMGAQPVSESREPSWAVREAEAAGLTVVDLRTARLRLAFYDLAAVVYFLRKVIWTVPDFTVDRYRDRLVAMDELIRAEGEFVSYATRFLIEARKGATG